MSKTVKKKKKKDTIYTKEQIEQILDRETSPTNIISEIIGVDVIKEVKKKQTHETIDPNIADISLDEVCDRYINGEKPEDKETTFREKMLPRLTRKTKAKNSRRYETNMIKF